ncbi:MAG: peptide deformylase, partial [Alphaproteobacteria bacterium]|nr:peptide deformylase [Alphaproteobacteria bacterium]
TCLQHEIDHHDGILFIDQISPMKRRIILERIKKKYKK